MAGSNLYKDSDDESITDINVTPFVDVVLVVLVVFMVAAKLMVTRGVEIPTGAGGAIESSLRVSVDDKGQLFVNNDKYDDDASAIAKIKALAATTKTPRVTIAGDRRGAYGGVMRAITLVQQAGITAIALENQAP